MEIALAPECSPSPGDAPLPPKGQKSAGKVVLLYVSGCAVELRTQARDAGTENEADDENYPTEGTSGEDELDNLLFSNWKRGCGFHRSTSDAKLPRQRPGFQKKTHAKSKEERRKGNVGQNVSSHKENVESKLSKLGLTRFGNSLYQRRSEGGNNGSSTSTDQKGRRKARWAKDDGSKNTQDHPAALKHALQQDKLPAETDEFIKLLAAAQFRDLTPEDYELLLTLDDSVKPKTVSKATVSAIEATEANVRGCVGDLCPVCMEVIGGTQKVKTLPCKHNFHAPCIDQWLTNCSRNCPLDGLAIDS